MPTPNKGENRKDFISRCMGDSEMNSKFPDQGQRYAVCNTKFDQKNMAVMPNDNTAPDQSTNGQTEIKPEKTKLDIITEIKKLLTKNNMTIDDNILISLLDQIKSPNALKRTLKLFANQQIKPTTNDQWILVFPKGKFWIQKYQTWLDCDDVFFNEIAKNFNDQALSRPFIDKDHKFEESFGDINNYKITDKGMFFNIKLNYLGVSAIKNGVYRYVSPAFGDMTDTAKEKHYNWLAAISLVNAPAFLGVIPKLQDQIHLKQKNFDTKESTNMELRAMLERSLQLATGANDAAFIKAVDTLQQTVTDLQTQLQTIQEALTKVTAERDQAKTSEQAAQGQVAQMKNDFLTKEGNEVLDNAIKLGQIPPALKDKYLKRYLSDKNDVLDDLKVFPKNDNGMQLSSAGTTDTGLSKEDREIAEATGYDLSKPADLKRFKNLMTEVK